MGVFGSFGSRNEEGRTKTRQDGHAPRLLPDSSRRLPPPLVTGGSSACKNDEQTPRNTPPSGFGWSITLTVMWTRFGWTLDDDEIV